MTHAMVTSRLDYCNSLYAGLPLHLTQKVQNVSWQLIAYQIQFKVMVLTARDPHIVRTVSSHMHPVELIILQNYTC